MGQNETAEVRDRELVLVALAGYIRPGKNHEVLAAAGLPIAFHRGDLNRLVVERVASVQVPQHALQGHQNQRQP